MKKIEAQLPNSVTFAALTTLFSRGDSFICGESIGIQKNNYENQSAIENERHGMLPSINNKLRQGGKKTKLQVCKGLIILLALSVLADSQLDDDQSGFISIDCGTEASYTDNVTTINYTPDSGYIETGINKDISSLHKDATQQQQQLNNVRSFPEGTKNCYTLNLPRGKDASYLIRAYFMYGNYDSLDEPPTFDLYLGVGLWDRVTLEDAVQIISKEIIHTPSTDYLYVCLAHIGSGTPFISGLELRYLNDSIYTRQSGSLELLYRHYTNPNYPIPSKEIRDNDDIYDRIWEPCYLPGGSSISTTMEVISGNDMFRLPSSVMKAAVTPKNVSSKVMRVSYIPVPKAEFYIYLHIAELQSVGSGQIREFNVMYNNVPYFGPFVPSYLDSYTIYFTVPVTGSELNIDLQSTKRSTLPPILNAIEIFTVKKLSQHPTNQPDVNAIMGIKSSYSLKKNWQGDPCVPKDYSWTGLNCSYDSPNSPRITALNLSSSELTGDIPHSISNLTALLILDLSNNNLSGKIPDFLSDLPLLKTLNLDGNNFNGRVPEKLLEKSRNGLLSLSVCSVANNPGLSSSNSCTSKKKKTSIGLVVASATLFVLLLAGFISFLVFRTRKKQKPIVLGNTGIQEPGYHSTRKGGFARFTYSEVRNMTDEFRRELGKGGFGVVYYGRLKDNMEVAVKMLSQTIHASEEFSTEVELLMTIRHKNLVSLVGYCEEGSHLALIFEYMACGNLHTVLSDEASHSLTWKQRLQIAIDAAQGLDYLHNGCRPPIVHRDVKTPNILLNKNLQAKIADFGLSKIFPDEYISTVSTRVMGTVGYLDPEYHVTEQLNEKSDVYSFGVVLLELITGKPAVVKLDELERLSLAQWVSPMLERGDIWSIVDKKLQEVPNSNSLWRSIDIAMACVAPTLAARPTMSQIVTELRECLAMGSNPGNSRTNNGLDDSIDIGPVISSAAIGPAAR